MAQAKLTPMAKILVAVAILAGSGAAAWHLGAKNFFADGPKLPAGEVDPASTNAVTSPAGNAGNAAGANSGAALGTAGRPLKVSLVSFHGYAPALVANGNALKTKPGSIFANNNVNVEFVIQDDIPTLATIFESGAAQCAWRTSDFWAQEQPNLRNNNLDARAVVIVDNTQGADAIIARDPAVQRVEDLVGKKVALLQYTPSHGMLIDAVSNSSLTAREKTRIQYVFINADEGTAGVRAAFAAGHVDAAVLWDPDLALAQRAVEGAHVIYSTKTATNLIYDVIVCDARVLAKPENQSAMQGFVKGWLEGVEVAQADEEKAVNALVETEEYFTLLARQEGRPFVKSLFANLQWTGLKDNIRILGLAGGTNHYERVYHRFDGIYRGAGALANPNSPVIPAADSFDYGYVRTLMDAQPAAREQAKVPQFTFDTDGGKRARQNVAALTKPVAVNFATGSNALTQRAQQVINDEMVPLIESNGAAYFQVSGNTDATGSRGANMRLSTKRAEAVVAYLVTQWEFPRARFIVVGNGPDKPLCDENKREQGMSLEDCRALNRTTRAAVLSR